MGQHVDQRGNAKASHLFIIAQRQMQGGCQRTAGGHQGGSQRRGNKPLHVRGPAPVVPPLCFGQHKGRARPDLPVNRHHIGMPRQHDTRPVLRADGGIEVRLAARRIREDLGGDPCSGKKLLHPVHQGKVGF